ncbi:MAG: sulfur carrier protein ThiS [Chthoniobacteraceae bacterium]
MMLSINGEAREVNARSIAELIVELGLPPAACLVEHNGNALRRDEWEIQSLSDGDRIELVRIVAGG